MVSLDNFRVVGLGDNLVVPDRFGQIFAPVVRVAANHG
jgi:hypothetical protein